MSRDQKPAKMRVIAGSGEAPHPRRRAEDQEPALVPAVDETETPRGSFRPLSILYMVGCAIGGVGVAMLVRGLGQ